MDEKKIPIDSRSIREKLVRINMTQKMFAEFVGMHNKAMSALLTMDRINTTRKQTVEKMAAILKCLPSDIILKTMTDYKKIAESLDASMISVEDILGNNKKSKLSTSYGTSEEMVTLPKESLDAMIYKIKDLERRLAEIVEEKERKAV